MSYISIALKNIFITNIKRLIRTQNPQKGVVIHKDIGMFLIPMFNFEQDVSVVENEFYANSFSTLKHLKKITRILNNIFIINSEYMFISLQLLNFIQQNSDKLYKKQSIQNDIVNFIFMFIDPHIKSLRMNTVNDYKQILINGHKLNKYYIANTKLYDVNDVNLYLENTDDIVGMYNSNNPLDVVVRYNKNNVGKNTSKKYNSFVNVDRHNNKTRINRINNSTTRSNNKNNKNNNTTRGNNENNIINNTTRGDNRSNTINKSITLTQIKNQILNNSIYNIDFHKELFDFVLNSTIQYESNNIDAEMSKYNKVIDTSNKYNNFDYIFYLFIYLQNHGNIATSTSNYFMFQYYNILLYKEYSYLYTLNITNHIPNRNEYQIINIMKYCDIHINTIIQFIENNMNKSNNIFNNCILVCKQAKYSNYYFVEVANEMRKYFNHIYTNNKLLLKHCNHINVDGVIMPFDYRKNIIEYNYDVNIENMININIINNLNDNNVLDNNLNDNNLNDNQLDSDNKLNNDNVLDNDNKLNDDNNTIYHNQNTTINTHNKERLNNYTNTVNNIDETDYDELNILHSINNLYNNVDINKTNNNTNTVKYDNKSDDNNRNTDITYLDNLNTSAMIDKELYNSLNFYCAHTHTIDGTKLFVFKHQNVTKQDMIRYVYYSNNREYMNIMYNNDNFQLLIPSSTSDIKDKVEYIINNIDNDKKETNQIVAKRLFAFKYDIHNKTNINTNNINQHIYNNFKHYLTYEKVRLDITYKAIQYLKFDNNLDSLYFTNLNLLHIEGLIDDIKEFNKVIHTWNIEITLLNLIKLTKLNNVLLNYSFHRPIIYKIDKTKDIMKHIDLLPRNMKNILMNY